MLAFTPTDRGLTKLIARKVLMLRLELASELAPDKAFWSNTGITIAVVYDADIGHLPPNMTLINGAFAEVVVEKGQAEVTQTLK